MPKLKPVYICNLLQRAVLANNWRHLVIFTAVTYWVGKSTIKRAESRRSKNELPFYIILHSHLVVFINLLMPFPSLDFIAFQNCQEVVSLKTKSFLALSTTNLMVCLAELSKTKSLFLISLELAFKTRKSQYLSAEFQRIKMKRNSKARLISLFRLF